MACADLLHASMGIPLDLTFLYTGTLWFNGPFGVFMCKFIPYSIVVSVVASITTLTATAIERYLAAKLILKKPITPKVAQIVVALIWIYALLISTHEVIKFNVIIVNKTTPHCFPVLEDWVGTNTIEMTIKFVLMYLLPLFTMATLYAHIIWMLRQHSGSSLQTEQYKSIQRRKKNLTRKLVMITVIFAVCWLPVHVNHFLATFDYALFTCIPSHWHLVFFWLAHANTAINPVLYLLLTKNARALFKSSVHAAKGDGNDNGSRRSGSRKLWMFQRFPSDSRLLTACVSIQTSEDEEKGHEMNLIVEPAM
ncbi:Tachykinin-like peptides receptor 99D [Exaiptasia diaphana]|nr:Tachykinin-like peptides receptor 99D [Exaiptasia diaphana]